MAPNWGKNWGWVGVKIEVALGLKSGWVVVKITRKQAAFERLKKAG